VLLFLRQPPRPDALLEWAQGVPDTGDVFVVVPQPTTAELPLPPWSTR
jgi:hypothetical protein